MSATSKLSLSPARRRLVELAQRIGFGQICDLHFRNGDPVADPPPRIERYIKIGGKNSGALEGELDDFQIKKNWVEVFNYLDAQQEGVVRVLVIKHGLPFALTVDEPV